MANRVRNVCRNLSVQFNRMTASRSRCPWPVEAKTVERRLPFGISGVHALEVSMKFRSILCKSLTATIPMVLLVVLYRIATLNVHDSLNIPLSAVAVLVAVVSLLMLMNIITSRSIIRQIKGGRLFRIFESADESTRRKMCDQLARLYNSNRSSIAKYDRIGITSRPWSCCILPKCTEILDVLEDTIEAWELSMNSAFRAYIQKRIDELDVDDIGTAE